MATLEEQIQMLRIQAMEEERLKHEEAELMVPIFMNRILDLMKWTLFICPF